MRSRAATPERIEASQTNRLIAIPAIVQAAARSCCAAVSGRPRTWRGAEIGERQPAAVADDVDRRGPADEHDHHEHEQHRLDHERDAAIGARDLAWIAAEP